ncbi:phage tail protein [Bifidobacterium longum]|uniref:Phage tail protein n=1 Tax=Bifidobacterium longum TaxID=216816 RepID=A0A6I1BUX3_BIFLN|nr:phage tail protein [Bifidobacterium longum]KAB6882666.1 phage tail protein [Bifidobacterium longum]KAB6885500.1 phage tail protein [Bifidobacterium longum]KAB6886003.1 phage tail protein [Bifidobacterium longum]KAB6889777.1 phage tail protein [Bifidobacterium longum]
MRYMIFDRWGNPLGDLPYAIKAIRTRATDGTDTLDITTIGEINKDERIVFKDSMGRWAEYLCQSTQTARAAGMPVTVAYCTGSIAELSRTYIEDKRNRNANAKACLAKALEGTRWAVGTVETGTITGTADLSFYHCTALEAIQKTADTYGLEVQTEYQPDPTGNQIGRRIIHLVEHRGTANTTKRFEYGKDLTQIKRDIDSGDVITRLYGWGKGIEQTNDQGEATGGYSRKISFADVNNGKPYIQDDNALANWGIVGADGTKHHSEASVDFPDCEDPKELLNLTKAALKTRTTPTVSYTADVTALGQAGYDPEGTDVGDSVQIIDTSFTNPLRLEGRILQIEEDLAGSLADTKITLGNIRQTYTQRLAAQQQALDKLVSNSGAWNSAAGGTGPYMKDLIDRINQIMNATGGYTYLKPGQGIYVYDKPEDQNPTQCIHIGGGYWRIADHKKPNGDWDFRALANGKGVFADTLFTGRLSDAAGLNFWDMDTGEFSLSAQSTIGGNKAGSLATQTQAQKLATDAQAAAKAYADSVGASTLSSARNDATAKADTALAGAKTYAEAIMAYGSNLVRNPLGDPDHDLDRLGAAKLTNTMPAAHPEGITSAIRLGNVRDTYFGWLLDSFRGHTFRISGWAYRKAGSATSSFGIHWTDTGNGNHWQAIANAAANASGWTYVSGSYTVPSNAKTARLWMQVDRDTTTASDADWYWTGLQCTDETAARSYVDTFEGELTQTYIFNKLTNNGQTQGIYLSNGLLYINATYMRTGIITGKRSYWNLDTGQFAMTDANGKETVHFSGEGGSNLLTGTFQTGLSGNRVMISPSFNQSEVTGADKLEGAGIQFYHGTDSYKHPYIAVESTTQQEGEVSALTFNGGRRVRNDPGAFGRIGERKDDAGRKYGTVYFVANRDYDEPAAGNQAGARIILDAYPYTSPDTFAALEAFDDNGTVGVKADINTGYLYMGGFLGMYASRGTFQSMYWDGTHHISPWTVFRFKGSWTPPRYGSYKIVGGVNNATGDALCTSAPCNESSSGAEIMVQSMPANVGGYSMFPGGGTNIWCTMFGYLRK